MPRELPCKLTSMHSRDWGTVCGRVNLRITLLTDSITLIVYVALRIGIGRLNIALMCGHFAFHCLDIVGYFASHLLEIVHLVPSSYRLFAYTTYKYDAAGRSVASESRTGTDQLTASTQTDYDAVG